MQVALGIGILVSLFAALVVIHRGTVNLLRDGALRLLRAANWCEAHRAAAAVSIQKRLENSLYNPYMRSCAPQKPTGALHEPIEALKVIVRVIETLPVELLEQALDHTHRGAGAGELRGDSPFLRQSQPTTTLSQRKMGRNLAAQGR